MISNYAVGVDNVDVDAASERGIPVGHTPDVLTDSTADLAVALMLAIARRLAEGERIVRAGEWGDWGPEWMLGRDLHGATVGDRRRRADRLGRRPPARRLRLRAWWSRGARRRGGSTELLAGADFVSVHTPLTPETRGLIGEPELRAMKRHGLPGQHRPRADRRRGARSSAPCARAGSRAPRSTSPTPSRCPPTHSLLGAPNLLVIPHLGSATHRTREAMADLAVDNLLAGLAGERLPACVNPEVYG